MVNTIIIDIYVPTPKLTVSLLKGTLIIEIILNNNNSATTGVINVFKVTFFHPIFLYLITK